MTVKSTIESLLAEQKQISAREKRRRKSAEKDSQRWFRIQHEILRLKTAELLNKPDAVQLASRRCEGSKCCHLNDLYGTLTDVRRTRCTVVFSNGESWTFPLDSIRPADDSQGFEIGASISRPKVVEPEPATE